jgi:hypothetical protein
MCFCRSIIPLDFLIRLSDDRTLSDDTRKRLADTATIDVQVRSLHAVRASLKE